MLVKDRAEEVGVCSEAFGPYHGSDTYKGGEESRWDYLRKVLEKV